MSDLAHTFDSLARIALLQSTIVFLAGILIARFVVRRPARVHTVLALTFMAVIVAPLASEMVRRVGWGILPPDSKIAAPEILVSTPSAPALETYSPAGDRVPSTYLPAPREAKASMVADTPRPNENAPSSLPASPTASSPLAGLASTESKPRDTVALRGRALTLLLAAWAIASTILLYRLARGVFAGRRLLRLATPCDAPAVLAALAAARDCLDIQAVRVDVCQSSAVRCPMIWCWGSRPRLLLPIVETRDWSVATWTPILCHELAHWKRRDHWAALTAEFVCCLMPWQALAWWAKRRLEHASEQACDDWAIAVGHPAVDYAEVLLSLVAQADPPLALAAMRRRSGLAGRIQHILSQSMPHPRLGRAWAVVVFLIAAMSICVAAVCQRGIARAEGPKAEAPKVAAPAAEEKKSEKQPEKKSEKDPEKKNAPKAGETASPAPIVTGTFQPGMAGKEMTGKKPATPVPPVASDDADDKPEHFELIGKVMNPDGKPIANAEVFWDYSERPRSNYVGEWPAPRLVAQARTDADGVFKLEADFSRKRMANHMLIVRAPGFGVSTIPQVPLNPSQQFNWAAVFGLKKPPIEIRLEPSAPIEGTIFSPDGVPVTDARVAIVQMSRGSDTKERYNGWHLGLTAAEMQNDPPRPYWPPSVTTDAQGKFRFDDATPRRAVADLAVSAPDYPNTSVSVRHPDSLPSNTRATYRDSNFTLVFEVPYVVNGRFLDEKTGAPIVNARVEAQPYSNRNTRNQETIAATTDDEGRYTMRVGSADMYFVKVYPPRGYPAVQTSISSRQFNQLGGPQRKVKYDVKLRPGIMVAGRVVDEKGEGVAGAQVHYQPEAGRKLGVNSAFFPVTTADDGTFEATAVDGKGFFLVDAPNKGFYRLAVQDSRVIRYREGLYPHGLLEIDVPAAGSDEQYVVALKRGIKLEVRALAPNGKPVQQMRTACAESSYEGFFNGEDTRDGIFRLDAAEPGRKYRVFINCETAKAGGVFEVEATADGKRVEVKLEPWATIRGRYVYNGGAPAPEVTNFTRFRLYADREPEGNAQLNLPFYDNFSGHQHTKRVTDAEGNFELDGMIPGAFIYLNLNNEFAGGKRNYEIGILKPGEVKDVGELVISAR